MNITKEERTEVIDPTHLSWGDMALLKKQDPFMYYSIPGNRDKRHPGEDIDLSGLDPAPDSMADGLSRSFTQGTFKDGRLVDETTPRRHSENTESNSAGSSSAKRRGSGATFEFELKCPSFTIKEEEVIFGPSSSNAHSRSKSEMLQLRDSESRSHRRNQTESDADHPNLVHRKSAISFESYVDSLLDDIIEEVAEFQPRRPSIQIDVARRGSVLQDVLFNSIAALGQMDDIDISDSDSDEY